MDLMQRLESGVYWKDVIYSVVNQENFDPWDIDVGALADAYLEKIREIKMVSFEIPGTVVLVGSVLVKLKSDMVSSDTFLFEENLNAGMGDEEEELMEAEGELGDLEEPEFEEDEDLPSPLDSQLYVRRVPKRKITLPELMIFLKKVINQAEKKERVREIKEETQMQVEVRKKDLERIMKQVHREIRRTAKGDKTTFRELVREWKKEAIVAYLFPVLHLAAKDKIGIEQKELFGEILIYLRE